MAGEGREGGVGEEGRGVGVLGDGSGDFAGGFGGRGAHFLLFLLWGLGCGFAGCCECVGMVLMLMLGFAVCDFDGEVLSKTDREAMRCS